MYELGPGLVVIFPDGRHDRRDLLADSAVVELQEDVAVADALLGEMALGDASLAEHSSPLSPGGSVFPVPVRVEVQVGVEVYRVQPANAAVGDAADNARYVDVAVLEVFELYSVVGGVVKTVRGW